MNQLINRNYIAVVARGLITPETTDQEFFDKLLEEVGEVLQAETPNEKYKELADVINVCTNWLRHRDQDVEKLLTDTAVKNEGRVRVVK